jgi:uncharacterized protein (TIGR02001 family)
MKKSLLAVALATAFALPAQAADAPAAPEAKSPHTLTGNVSLYSSYRFRGIDQTFGRPALQGGVDYSHESGIYLGNWNSNVNSGAGFAEGNLEMDFYGGYKTSFGDFGFDLGLLHYYYPGSSARPLSGSNHKHPSARSNGAVNNTEVYVGVSWKFLSLKYSYALSDYFDLPDSDGTGYLDLSASYDLGNGWGINGHVGHLYANDYSYEFTTGSRSISYTDWKVGVTKDVNGWLFGLAYVGTNANGNCSKAEFYCFTNSLNKNGNLGSDDKDAGRGVAVLSVTKTF